jgi:probable HAF family extracellular repeat protein
MRRLSMRRLPFLAVLLVLSSATSSLAVDHYQVRELNVGATAINNEGHIAGVVDEGKGWRACIWINGKITLLDPGFKYDWQRHPQSSADAINDHDQVVWSRVSSGAISSSYGYFWEKGGITELGGTEGWGGGARSINNKGQMAGVTENGKSEDHGSDGLVWSDAETPATNLSAKYQWRWSAAHDINDHSDVVGYYTYKDEVYSHPFLLSDGVITDVKIPAVSRYATSVAVNNRRQVIGYWIDGKTTRSKSFFWNKGDIRMVAVPRADSVTVVDINDRGQVVGYARKENAKTNSVGFLWENGHTYRLISLIRSRRKYSIVSAAGINNKGQIICSATRNGKAVNLLLTPITRQLAPKRGK